MAAEKTVLVVDDQEDIADLFALSVSFEGCHAITAYDGREAASMALEPSRI